MKKLTFIVIVLLACATGLSQRPQDPTLLITGLVVSIGIIHALMFAPEAAFTAELFPTEVRVSGSSLGKQLGIILGGGIAPLVGTALMGSSGSFTPVILSISRKVSGTSCVRCLRKYWPSGSYLPMIWLLHTVCHR